MKKRICPRCQNEEINECANFCKICGLELKKVQSTALVANIKIEGLEKLKEISADSHLKVETICTGKTSVDVRILES